MRRLVLSIIIYHLAFSLAEAQKPWTFWYWMYGAVSEAGIKADLQAMKEVGLGGCYLMPIRGTEQAPANMPPLPGEPAQQLSPRFWTLVDYAMLQAEGGIAETVAESVLRLTGKVAVGTVLHRVVEEVGQIII